MVVDGVSEVLTLPKQAVEAAPAIATTVNAVFITGMASIHRIVGKAFQRFWGAVGGLFSA